MDAPPQDGSPKPGRGRGGGAPKDNSNAQRHGLRSGKLPRDCRYIEENLNRLRRDLEAAVLRVRSEVTLTDAALIQSCIRWEKHSQLSQRWLRVGGDSLSPGDKLKFSEAVAKASDQRDRALARLRLDVADDPPPWTLPAPARRIEEHAPDDGDDR